MRIAYVAAGAADMICGTCLHDNAFAGALLRQGHEVSLIPTYTPLRTDGPDVSIDRVFFGALNVYLQQKVGAFRRTPAAFDRWLDRPGLIRRVSRLGASTDPTELGDLTWSVLKGEEGYQAKELARLVAWLRDDLRPEIVHLTNSMFVGFARSLKRELGVPVVCSLQGEDLFLGQLREPWKTRAFEVLRERARDVDAFLAHSAWYAGTMAELLQVDRGRLHVVPLGLNLDGFGEQGDQGEPRPAPAVTAPVTLGYLARVCPEKGLHLLVEAFRLLAADPAFAGKVRLRAAGWLGARDRRYFEDLVSGLAADGLAGAFEYAGEVDRAGKSRFLQSLDILSVPTTYREPKGLFVLEALAHGVPVVQPRHGAFPEMLAATGGGLLVEPGSAEDLARGLARLIADPELRAELGRRGREAVHQRFTDAIEAENVLAVYRRVLAERLRERVPA
ncbi:MAG TPA: glycosyltransferase family 4 protein [Thermoanaerobaculia bacterium]|jgi:glycosyltransferase involved in cell wall biosynthesis